MEESNFENVEAQIVPLLPPFLIGIGVGTAIGVGVGVGVSGPVQKIKVIKKKKYFYTCGSPTGLPYDSGKCCGALEDNVGNLINKNLSNSFADFGSCCESCSQPESAFDPCDNCFEKWYPKDCNWLIGEGGVFPGCAKVWVNAQRANVPKPPIGKGGFDSEAECVSAANSGNLSPICPPTPTPSITPEPTPGPGAWCVVKQCEDGNFVKTGACSSGSWEDWKNADAAGTAGGMSFGSSCESINCEEEQCVTPTPPTTYNVNMLFVTPTPLHPHHI